MCQKGLATNIRPHISEDDFQMILNALSAYSHNTEYRDLHDRLSRQAQTWGMIKGAPKIQNWFFAPTTT